MQVQFLEKKQEFEYQGGVYEFVELSEGEVKADKKGEIDENGKETTLKKKRVTLPGETIVVPR